MLNPSTNDQPIEMKFDALRLYPGAAMQLQSMSAGKNARHEIKFIGFIKDKSLLVTLPFQDGEAIWMQPGKTFIVRGFNGIYAYAFKVQVIRAHANPSTYVHFSWPNEIDCQLVRHSLRVAAALAANVSLPDNSTVDVTMLDLSASGSMLDSPAEFGAVGEHARIEFAVDFEGSTMNLNIAVIVCNTQQKEDGTGFRIGVGFENIAQNEALILHYYINSIALKLNL